MPFRKRHVSFRRAPARKKSSAKKRSTSRKKSYKPRLKIIDAKKYTSAQGTTNMDTNSAARFRVFALTQNVFPGGLPTQRIGDQILQKNLYIKLAITNFFATDRFFRLAIVGFRGATAGADTTNLSDIMIDSAYTKVGPTGLTVDIFQRLNRDEWLVYYDRIIKLHGTGTGVSNTVTRTFNKRLNVPALFLYNANTLRKGDLYLVWWLAEQAGTAVNAAISTVGYSYTLYFADVSIP